MPGAAVEVVEGGAAVGARGADQIADPGRALVGATGNESGIGLSDARHQALDVDGVALVGAELLARHAGALDVPGDEGRRPGDVIEAAALGMADARPVIVDALPRLALLDAELLGSARRA